MISLTKRKRRKNNRRRGRGDFRNSVIVMLILLCLFFATGTDGWFADSIRSVMAYAGFDTDINIELPENFYDNPLFEGIRSLTERSNGDNKSAAPVEGEMAVHILDVGQGSACLVESDGHYMLIDGGPGDSSSFVVAYLKEQGVHQLDYIIASHYDADHISGLVGVLNVYPVQKLLGPDYEADSKIYASLIRKISENGCEVIHPEAGESYTLGEAVFTVVAPVRTDYEDENNLSVGIRLVHGENSFLILGDAEAESEADICSSGQDIRSDVYLVNHHGSSSSTTAELLSYVQPAAAVISCGEGNAYGHPHEQTLVRLKDAGADLYRTDLQGTLTVISDGNDLEWNQEPCMDFTPGDAL